MAARAVASGPIIPVHARAVEDHARPEAAPSVAPAAAARDRPGRTDEEEAAIAAIVDDPIGPC